MYKLLAQGYYSKAVLARLEPATSESLVRDLTTTPLSYLSVSRLVVVGDFTSIRRSSICGIEIYDLLGYVDKLVQLVLLSTATRILADG